MTLNVFAERTRSQVLACSNRAIETALASCGVVDVIVPTFDWGRERKLKAAAVTLGGASFQTYAQWLGALWDLNGDGRRIVSPSQRMKIARRFLAGILGNPPSHALLREYCAFLEEACALDVHPNRQLTDAQLRIVESVGEYKDALEHCGLIEPADVERQLLEGHAHVHPVVVEGQIGAPVHRMRFFEDLAGHAEVTVVQRSVSKGSGHEGAGSDLPSGRADELVNLERHLFRRGGHVHAGGAVVAGEAHGAHIEGELVARLCSLLRGQSEQAKSVAVVFNDAADSYPHVQEALLRADVPFECSFSQAVKSTPFGTAFLNLRTALESSDEEESYAALAGFVSSRYSGVDPADARAVQMRWRMRAKSTKECRVADICEGFAQGNADAATVKERLSVLAGLLAANPTDAVHTMFENARARCGLLDASLIDDARVADAILDYFEECEGLACDWSLEDLAHVSVTFERSFGEDATSVKLIGSADLGISEYDCVVLANLDAAHHPMATSPASFDSLLSALGAEREDVRALQQRCLLLDCIEAASGKFAFYRVCNDRDGAESCQSALWDELVGVYREEGEPAGAVWEVPPALEKAGSLVRLSEAQVFAHDGQHAARSSQHVHRGALESCLTSLQLAQYLDGDAIPFSPTALEDYYRCPYRWFTSRRVGYNGMDNSFAASAQGNLAHGFFDAFYKRLNASGYRRLTPENLEEGLALADEVFAQQVEKGLDKPRSGLFLRTELDKLNCRSILDDAKDLLRRDAYFLPGFEPRYFELELGRGTGAMLTYAGVPVRGKVDRIDVDANGRAVVIDYKLSSLSSGYGLRVAEELPQRIQTDIYASLVQRHLGLVGEHVQVVGSVYRSYSTNMLRGVYESGLDWGSVEQAALKRDAIPNEDVPLNYAAYLEKVESCVEECMSRLSRGDIEPRPIGAGVCEYCKALEFCPKGGA